MENENVLKFKKMYAGSAEGVSKKNNKPYCFISFVDINNFGSAYIKSYSLADGKLPEICKNLVVGDIVEVSFNIANIGVEPVVLSVDGIVHESLLIKRN